MTVNSVPATPTITASGPTTFCAGDSVILTSSSATNNIWTPGGATTQSITVLASGSYSVIVDNGSCASAASNTINVTVNPAPTTPTITASGPTTFCTGDSVVLTSSAANGYLWTPGGATTQSITVLASGSYSVQISDVNGCTANSASTVVTANPVPATPTITASGPTTFCAGDSVILTSSSATNNIWTPGGATTQSITVTASGTYSVEITDANGCSATSTSTTVTVNPLPATPSITASGPTTFCAGDSVILTSSSATNNVWSPGGQTTQSITVLASGTYSVVVNNGGCISGSSNSIAVTVNPAPAVPTITASGPTTFCAGDSVVLTSSSANSYLWNPGGATTQSITVTASGTYSVEITDANGCSATSTSTTVTVNPLPATPSITASGPTTFCAGDSVILTSSSATNNVWSPGGQTTQSITVLASGTYSVVVNNGGCISGNSNTITVTVNSAPAAPTITASGPTTFCAGDSVVLTSSSSVDNIWSPGGATTQSITVVASGTYSAILSNGACISGPSNSIVVTVNPLPATPTISASGPTSFCAGDSVVLTSSSATGNLWTPGGATTQSITVSATGTYTVQVTQSGCTSLPSAAVSVTVNPVPAAPNITASGPTTFCSGDSVILTSSVATGNLWSPGGQTTQSITVLASGTYSVTQTLAGCSSNPSNTITVNVTPAPAGPTITPSGPTTFCAGGSVTLTSSASTGNTWSPGGQLTQSIVVTSSGTFTVTETILGCVSAPSAPITVTVNPIPATPTVTASGPTTFCAGGSVTLTSSATAGNLWSPGGQTTQSIVVNTAGSYSVVTSSLGCSSAPSTPTVVTVNANPAVPTISASGPTSFCTGGSVTLTSSSTTNNTWSPGGATTQSIVATTSGSYTVQVSNAAGCTATSLPTVVTATAQPATPTITANGPTAICPGGNVMLTSSSGTGNLWSPGGQTMPSILVTTAGTYSVVVTTNGCSSNPSAPVVVTINPLPVAQFTSTTTGLSASFIDNSTNNPTAWSWDFGDGTTSSLQNPTHTYATGGTYNVCLTASNSCGNDVICQAVTVCAPMTPNFNFSANLLAVNFTDITTGAPTSWAWDFGDGTTSSLQNPSHSYAIPGTYNACLTVTDACTTQTVCRTVVVTCPSPNASFTFAVLGNTVNFTVQSTTQGNPTYVWDFGDGNTGNGLNPSHTYAVGGNYTVCLTISNQCGSDTFCDTVTIACPAPISNFSMSTNGLTVNFTDLSANTPTSWFWDFGDGNSSTLQNPTHTYATDGVYNVCLTATNSCDSDKNCKDTDQLVGVANAIDWNSVNLYPNPAQDRFTVSGEDTKAGRLEIRVYDLFGRLLIEQSSNAGLSFTEEVSLEGLASSVYLVKVSKAGKSRIFRLVKE